MKRFFKEYFTFSKGDKTAFTVFVVILLFVLFIPLLYDTFFVKEKELDYSQFKEEVLAFELSQKKEVERRMPQRAAEKRDFDYDAIDRSVRKSQLTPFLFNPNNLPTEKWQAMGLSDRQIRGIKNYEAKGGRFFIKDDLRKMFVISDDEYEILKPYIDLPDKRIRDAYRASPPIEEEIVLIDINSADTSLLRALRGVGPWLSRNIVKYRDEVGGFHRKEQLLEVFGIDTALYKTLVPYVTIEEKDTRKININTASFHDLNRHPYISRNVAMSIVNIRSMHGPYESLADVMKSALINDELFYKIVPYISIEDV